MWPRVVETMIGVWLLLSPFVFGHPDDGTAAWATDLACGSATLAFALLSFWRPTRHARWGLLLVVAWLLAYGYFGTPTPPPPHAQNDLVVGLLLLMLALLPNEVNQPPERWRTFQAGRQKTA